MTLVFSFIINRNSTNNPCISQTKQSPCHLEPTVKETTTTLPEGQIPLEEVATTTRTAMVRTITPMTMVASTIILEVAVLRTPLPVVSLSPTLLPNKVVIGDFLSSIL